ncbi:AAT22 [Candida pseudojiufengensis]|uniref:AAT22 n=1 Tax=Candida pseudojiufengensis TaxID=497109 RepID=UPI00222581C0|nr:AAT22 [Candida pseudojiufengensis]KAI5965723.1 AAT22 [Candida pseudojiufengensis]
MTIDSIFSDIIKEEPDPIIKTMEQFSKDENPKKIDLSIGVYKDPQGNCYEFPSIKLAKQILNKNDPGNNYTNMGGIPNFLNGAQDLIFGSKIKQSGKIVSLQTISGTGSLHIAMILLREVGFINYYIGTPTWQNYIPMIEHIRGNVKTYNYYNEIDKSIDFENIVEVLNSADSNSIFLFQTCCHNPTGTDFTKDQWEKIVSIVKQKNLKCILDTAYQGFQTGNLSKDIWPITLFFQKNLEFLVCQSFAKNMGLYSERCGALHVVVQDKSLVSTVKSQLVKIFRNECSFAPAYGSRLANIIFENYELRRQWEKEIENCYNRLNNIRNEIYNKLTHELKTPGNWKYIKDQNGLFWYSGFNEKQVSQLIRDYHIYVTDIGRINLAGLNDNNIEYFCNSIDKVIRS